MPVTVEDMKKKGEMEMSILTERAKDLESKCIFLVSVWSDI